MHVIGFTLKHRRIAAAGLAAAAVALAMAAGGTAPARAATTCTWAGTPVAPTGWFTIDPGVTALPMAEPGKFVATGPLAGDDPRCQGQMKWVGQVDAGSTCAVASFEGVVKGLPGVARFWGKGNLLVPSQLYDSAGHLVGVENANIMTQHNSTQPDACTTPEGFTAADFSSVIELYN
jgi:hypothetical protein